MLSGNIKGMIKNYVVDNGLSFTRLNEMYKDDDVMREALFEASQNEILPVLSPHIEIVRERLETMEDLPPFILEDDEAILQFIIESHEIDE